MNIISPCKNHILDPSQYPHELYLNATVLLNVNIPIFGGFISLFKAVSYTYFILVDFYALRCHLISVLFKAPYLS